VCKYVVRYIFIDKSINF